MNDCSDNQNACVPGGWFTGQRSQAANALWPRHADVQVDRMQLQLAKKKLGPKITLGPRLTQASFWTAGSLIHSKDYLLNSCTLSGAERKRGILGPLRSSNWGRKIRRAQVTIMNVLSTVLKVNKACSTHRAQGQQKVVFRPENERELAAQEPG